MPVSEESFFLLFLTCPVQSDVTRTATAVIVKVIRSRCAHINEPQSLLMELQ